MKFWAEDKNNLPSITRYSHRRRRDRVSYHRAVRGNARGVMGRDRDLGRHPIHVRRDTDAVDRANRRYRCGCVSGALEVIYFGANLVAFAVAIFLVGLLRIVSRLEKTAYRYASITLTIIVLIPRSASPWIVALNRFIEVSIGIIVALAVVALWPEHQPSAVKSADK
jgi:hypothetical protein